MAMIKVSNLTFGYDGSSENVFENVSFTIDSNWKLGFIGRNGKGKTTFLKLLMDQYEYNGNISSNEVFDYFPFEVPDTSVDSYAIAEYHTPNYEEWKLVYEVSLLDMDPEILTRPFNTLSKGEQTKVLLAILFLRDNNFLLIDEPTNHLDSSARESVAEYLRNKKGFILVSHDRTFLDNCVDHILAINRSNIEVQQGNFSSWWENKTRQDNFELSQNDKLKKDINRLEKSARQTASWADKVEASKYNIRGDLLQDKGYIGHKSAKMMKRSIVTQQRKNAEIEEKSKLLKNIETTENLKINVLENRRGKLIDVHDLTIIYDDNMIFEKVSFSIEDGDRLQLKGKNGCGKSSIIKLLLGEDIKYEGTMHMNNDLKISYVSQDTSFLSGDLRLFARDNNLDEPLFRAILNKLDFDKELFNRKIESYSEGQKKKILIAKSLSEQANIYIWDEPLNYIDIFSRMQIEEAILSYEPTMIFVEHDETFSDKIATKQLVLNRK